MVNCPGFDRVLSKVNMSVMQYLTDLLVGSHRYQVFALLHRQNKKIKGIRLS